MDRSNLRQLFGSLFWLMAIFAALGQTWAVWPMTIAGLGWLVLWLALPGAALGALLAVIAAVTGR
ncbi:hypothetical protein SAMN04488120_101320 [Fontimonas thermophila]|mgnify:CR=1 FL=1|uniref:Uncharacterized protein n=1 Tax=Fontimonas thermophila TaxID=1076937 RepID=A0A1I2HCF7_9GAMM|nr:hypothetical protein [Fontimonas thermophila]SFF27342.1 hypothetical protein SAMN04488120_101320 [Fontimonas thermophila]